MRRHTATAAAAALLTTALLSGSGAEATGSTTFTVEPSQHDGAWTLVEPGRYLIEVSGTWADGAGLVADAECTSTDGGDWLPQAYEQTEPPLEDRAGGGIGGELLYPRLDRDVVDDGYDLKVGSINHPPGLPYRMHEQIESREGRSVEWKPVSGDASGCDGDHAYATEIVTHHKQKWAVFRIDPPDADATGALTVTVTPLERF